MTNPSSMRLKLWGTRGSIPCPGPETVKYGGNTTCFEVTCGKKRIIIDAGTGIRLLGKKIMLEEANLLNADLFFTHTHMDHIQGLPFFAPLYNPNSDVRLNAGHLGGEKYDFAGYHWDYADEGSGLSRSKFPHRTGLFLQRLRLRNGFRTGRWSGHQNR